MRQRHTALVMLIYLAVMAVLVFATDIDGAALWVVAVAPMAYTTTLSSRGRCCCVCGLFRKRRAEAI